MYLSFRGLWWHPWNWSIWWFPYHRLAAWHRTWSYASPLHHKEETGFNLRLNKGGTWCVVRLGVCAVCWSRHRRGGRCYRHRGQLDVWSQVWNMPRSFLAQQGTVLLVIQWDDIRQWKLFSGKSQVMVYMKSFKTTVFYYVMLFCLIDRYQCVGGGFALKMEAAGF